MSADELRRDAAESNEIAVTAVSDAQAKAITDRYLKDWKEWPTDLGAPYIDRNKNGRYDPPPDGFTTADLIAKKYDEPGVAGIDPDSPADQVIWTVFNDLNRATTTGRFGSEPSGLEIQATIWGYKRSDALGNVYFRKWRFINKGGVEIDAARNKGVFYHDSMYVCQWSDPDLGEAGDDLAGCDVDLSMGFIYNGNPVDLEFRKVALPPPSSGYDFLQGPIVPAPGERAVFDLKYRDGFKNLGMSGFSYFSAGSPYSDPTGGYATNSILWYKMLRGFVPLVGADAPYAHPPGVTPGPFPLSGDPVKKTGHTDGLGTNYSFKQKGFQDEVIEVAAVIGGGHLYGGGTQSYFAEFPDGTLRFLPFDYSLHNQTWFSQVRENNAWVPVSAALALDALQEWPPSRVLGATSDFSNCQNCHASQLLVYYDLAQKRYVTRYKNFENYFSIKLPILADNPHLADGRIRSFAYQQNHLYSDCYLNGSLSCVDCHDPHSQKYRDIYGRELSGRFDNQQCLDCHASKAQNLAAHTHHPPNSPGSACVACHMPYLQHRGIGAQIHFTRSDHSIATPRPEFDAGLGIASACQQCHAPKTVAWLEKKTQEWYGALKPHKTPVSGLLQAETLTDRQAAAELLLQPNANHAMAQYAGLRYFIQQFLQPDLPDLETAIVEKLKALCRESDTDLQALALVSLHLALGQQAEIRAFLIEILKNSGAHETALRTRWALALDYLGTSYVEKGDYAKAIAVHQKGLEINPDDPIILLNLGIAYGSQGDLAQAIAAFQAALALEPANAKVFVNLAAAYSRQQNSALVLNLDYARFRYDDQKNYLEVYYSLYPSLLTYRLSAGTHHAGVKLMTRVRQSTTRALLVERRALLPLAITDTSGSAFRFPFTTQAGYIVPFGDYTLEVVAVDSLNPARRDSVNLPIKTQSYPEKLAMSDVELCSRVQMSAKRDGPFFKNSLEVVPNPSLVFGVATHPVVFNYAELYNLDPAATYMTKNRIINDDGQIIKETSRSRKYGMKDGVEAGQIMVTSVASGKYTFRLMLLDAAGQEVARAEKAFYIYNPHLQPQAPAVSPAAGSFNIAQLAGLSDEELSGEFQQAQYLTTKDDIKFFAQLTSKTGKKVQSCLKF